MSRRQTRSRTAAARQSAEEPERASIARETPEYTLYRIRERMIRRFHVFAATYELVFTNLSAQGDILEVFSRALTDVVDYVFDVGQPGQLVGLNIDNDKFVKGPILSLFCPREELTIHKILSSIELVLTSADSVNLHELTTIQIVRVDAPSVGGGFTARQLDGRRRLGFAMRKDRGHLRVLSRTVMPIANHDQMCLPRALVCARAWVHRNESVERRKAYRCITRGENKHRGGHRASEQTRMSRELIAKAFGGEVREGPFSIPADLLRLQAALGDGDEDGAVKYTVVVWSRENRMPIWPRSPAPGASFTLHLLLASPAHVDVLRRPHKLLNAAHFCDACFRAYRHEHQHRCAAACGACHSVGRRCPIRDITHCELCLRYFYNFECFSAHQLNGCCEKFRLCAKCGCLLPPGGGECRRCILNRTCPHCKKNKTDDEGRHALNCFHQPLRKPACFSTRLLHIAYDFETRFADDDDDDDDVGAEGGKKREGGALFHTVNCVVATRSCPLCRGKDPTKDVCESCGQLMFTWSGENALDDFLCWLFQPCHEGAICFAHNAKSFDHHFLISYLCERGNPPDVVMRRMQLISFTAMGCIKFLDTRSFFPMRLAALPRTFELGTGPKGVFPFLFNRRENWSYVGEYPPLRYYAPERLRDEDRAEFYAWHSAQRGKTFNFVEQLEYYCQQDVLILRAACDKFEQLFHSVTDVHPYASGLTLSSACKQYFRWRHLLPNEIGVIGYGGYECLRPTSDIAQKWMKLRSLLDGVRIQHGANGGEVKVANRYFVDGAVLPAGDGPPSRIFEFHGCYWHGCPDCFRDRGAPAHDGVSTMHDVYMRTMARLQEMQRVLPDTAFTCVWECQFRRALTRCATTRALFNAITLVPPLRPREGLRGGRTSVFRMLYRCPPAENHRIYYFDVVSLYASIMLYERMPIGHPIIDTEITDEHFTADYFDRYFGIFHALVLPPRREPFGVLGIKCHERLTFPLCRTCCEEQNVDVACTHTDDQRALRGVWASCEMRKAVEREYRVLKIFERWHYPRTKQYDRVVPASGLFSSYILEWQKIKLQASGWPPGIVTKQQRAEYLDEVAMNYNILLDEDLIERNEGLRTLAKLCSNILYGSMIENAWRTTSVLVDDPVRFFELLADAAKEICAVRAISDTVLLVSHRPIEQAVPTLPGANVVIGLMITALGRTKLYSLFERVGLARLLYVDTDSAVVLCPHRAPTTPSSVTDRDIEEEMVAKFGSSFVPPQSALPGGWSNELASMGGHGAHASKWVAPACKTYAMNVLDAAGVHVANVVKAKGITQNCSTSDELNFDSMEAMTEHYIARRPLEPIRVPREEIVRTPSFQLYSHSTHRSIQPCSSKRVCNPMSSVTLPYGHALCGRAATDDHIVVAL